MREKILNYIYANYEIDDLWRVSIVWKDLFGNLEHKTAYFESRFDAEQWFSYCTEKIQKFTNGCYYGFCCDRTFYYNVDELLEEKNHG